jgi:hypothetical protein
VISLVGAVQLLCIVLLDSIQETHAPAVIAKMSSTVWIKRFDMQIESAPSSMAPLEGPPSGHLHRLCSAPNFSPVNIRASGILAWI